MPGRFRAEIASRLPWRHVATLAHAGARHDPLVRSVEELLEVRVAHHAVGNVMPEVRTLRLVTLRALDGGYGVELPICRPAAARFRTRGLPLQVSHVLLRGWAAAAAVLFVSAPRAEALAALVTQCYVRQRCIDELPYQIL